MTSTTIKQLSGRQVLIVEDEIDTGENIAMVLRRRGGAQTHLATSVSSARAALDQGPMPDILLLDHNLRGDTGTAIARQVRKQQETAAPKIVSFSAQPRESILAACDTQLLFDLILTKGDTSLEELLRQLSLLFTE